LLAFVVPLGYNQKARQSVSFKMKLSIVLLILTIPCVRIASGALMTARIENI
jgi:hypothetical protein